MPVYDTVANIVSDASIELGLGPIPDVFGATEENFVQLRYLLKTVGRRLILEHTWLQQVKEHTFVTSGSSLYPLPVDFSRMIDQTGWNRTQDMPAYPVSPQQWQYLEASGIQHFTVMFRPRDGMIQIWPASSTGETIAFEYASTYWVKASGSILADKNAPTANTDLVMFDALLAVKALVLSFKRTKGFDTTAAQEEFDAAIATVSSADASAAPVLRLTKMWEDWVLCEPPVTIVTGGASTPSETMRDFTLSTSLSVGTPVYILPDGTVGAANASSSATAPCIGIIAALTSPTVASVQSSGFFDGLSGLVAGTTYYLAVGGGLSSSAPIVPGQVVQKVGVAASATELLIEPEIDFEVVEAAAPEFITRDFTVPPGLTVGTPVYILSDGSADAADATSVATAPCVGLIFDLPSPTTATVQATGFFTGLSGLTPGTTYFLAVGGGLTTTPPSTVGNVIQKIGVASSATELVFEPVLDFTVI